MKQNGSRADHGIYLRKFLKAKFSKLKTSPTGLGVPGR